MLSRDELLRRFDGIRQANIPDRGRAPHKPLFLLYLLGRLQQRPAGDLSPLRVAYREADDVVSPLIAEFGPPAEDPHRARLPFYHLDPGLWRLQRDGLVPRHAMLRDRNVVGEFDPDVVATLARDPALLVEVAWRLLRANFPDAYVEPICQVVGLDLTDRPAGARPERRAVSARFRAEVLCAYEHACAFCGYAAVAGLGGTNLAPVGLAAAHVHWRAYSGPDHVTNGLALCDLHHTLFDRGLLGVDERRTIVVSPRFTPFEDRARALIGELRLREPRAREHAVADTHFAWHRSQVFRHA